MFKTSVYLLTSLFYTTIITRPCGPKPFPRLFGTPSLHTYFLSMDYSPLLDSVFAVGYTTDPSLTNSVAQHDIAVSVITHYHGINKELAWAVYRGNRYTACYDVVYEEGLGYLVANAGSEFYIIKIDGIAVPSVAYRVGNYISSPTYGDAYIYLGLNDQHKTFAVEIDQSAVGTYIIHHMHTYGFHNQTTQVSVNWGLTRGGLRINLPAQSPEDLYFTWHTGTQDFRQMDLLWGAQQGVTYSIFQDSGITQIRRESYLEGGTPALQADWTQTVGSFCSYGRLAYLYSEKMLFAGLTHDRAHIVRIGMDTNGQVSQKVHLESANAGTWNQINAISIQTKDKIWLLTQAGNAYIHEVDFALKQSTAQQIMPPNNLRVGTFKTPSSPSFYAVGYNTQLSQSTNSDLSYQAGLPSQFNGGFLFSSDAGNACYDIYDASKFPPTQIPLTDSTLSDSSTLFFTDTPTPWIGYYVSAGLDINLIQINESLLTSTSSWCENEYMFEDYTAQGKTFKYFPNHLNTFDIPEFRLKQSCLQPTMFYRPAINYVFIDYYTHGQPHIALANFIQDKLVFQNMQLNGGLIQIQGTIAGTRITQYANFYFQVRGNTAPYIIPLPPAMITIKVLQMFKYTLPVPIDDEMDEIQVTLDPLNGENGAFMSWENQTLVVLPNVNDQEGVYQVSITLTDIFQYTTAITFNVQVLPNYATNSFGAVLSNPNPPQFTQSLSDLEVKCGEIYDLKLPDIKDQDNDIVEPPKFILAEAAQFVKITPSSLIISPSIAKCMDQKKYKVTIVLTDINSAPRSKKVKLQIITVLQSSIENIINKNQNKATPKKVMNADLIAKDLTATITSIDERGNVIVRFSQGLNVPENYSSFDEDFLKISVIRNKNSELSLNKNITSWNVTGLTERQMMIAINFSQPDHISTRASEKDKLSIQFIANGNFLTIQGGKALPENYSIRETIPMQIVFTQALLKLENVGQSSSSTMIYGVIANLVIQIFMSFSMHMMWGLMNTLQLISCIFKFNLLIPPNVYMFFKSIEEFLSMKAQFVNNIVEWVNEKVFKLNTELSDGAKGNPIQNMGTYLIAAFAIILAMIGFGLIACFGSRFIIVKKLLDSLRNKLFYNSLLRLGIQSYLKNAILAISGWQFMSYDTNEEFKKSVIIIIMSIVVFLYPITICFFLLMNEKQLNTPSMRASYESTYANLRIFKASLLSPTIFMFRRLLLAIALGLLENYTFLQLLYVSLASSAYTIYVFKVRPYEVPFLNTIEIVNEINLSICSFLAIFFTDYEPNEGSIHLAGLREQVGWVIISICCFNILATIFKILSDVFLKIKGIINSRMHKAKIEQSQKETDVKSCEPINDITQLNQSHHGPTLKAKQKLDAPTIVEDLTNLSQFNLGLQENDFYYRTDDKAKIAFTPSTYKPKLSPYLEIAKELQRIPQFLIPLQKYQIPSEFKQSNLPPIFGNESCFLPDAIKNLSRGNDADQRLREIQEDIQREETGSKRAKKSNLSKRNANGK